MDGPWTQYAKPAESSAPSGPWTQYASMKQEDAPSPNAAPLGGEYGDLAAQSAAPAPEPGALERIAGAGIKGAEEGFGSPAGQTILSPAAQEWMDAKQRGGGVGGFLAGLGSTAAQDVGTIGGVVAGAGNALFRGGQAAVAQTGAEVGAPQLGRDIAAIPEAFMGSPDMLGHGTKPTITARDVQARDGVGIMEAWQRAHTENTAAAIADIGKAPDIDSAIEAAGKAAQAPVDAAQMPGAGGVTAPLGAAEAAIGAVPEAAVPQSVGAAASRDNTLPADIAMAPDEFAANRSQGEIERLALPAALNDKNIYIPGTKLTLAEVSGNPHDAMDQAYNRQQPEAMQQHIAQENHNADLVADYYADTAGSAPKLLSMERARDTTAQQNIQSVFGDPKSQRAPANPSKTINLMDDMLNDPRQAERNSVVKILSSLSEKFYGEDGNLKTDPYALYGIGEHINDLMRGAGDVETNSAARVLKRELVQIKESLYNDIEDAAPGFAKYRADYQRDSHAIDAMQYLQDARLRLLSGNNQHITPAKWFSFMRGIVEGRADPMDAASALSESQMDRLWNITDQLKRSTLIDAGKPRGSWTSMMQEWGGKFARLGAHGVAGYTFPVVGNLGVEMGVAGLRKRSVTKEMNRVLNPDLGQQP